MGNRRTSVTLSEYVERRNSVPLGSRASLATMLHRSLGAATLAGFWRYWNPIWGYYLSRYVNAPLRTILPAAPAAIATFAASGAIHDGAVYVVTGSVTFLFVPWFCILGLLVVASSRAGLRYEFRTWAVRAAINIALVVGPLGVVAISKRMLDLS